MSPSHPALQSWIHLSLWGLLLMPAGEWVPPLSLGLHLILVHSQTTWWTFLKGKSLHLQGYMGHSRSLPGWPGPQGKEDKGVSQLYHEQLCHLECLLIFLSKQCKQHHGTLKITIGMKEACTQHIGWGRYVETHMVAVSIAMLSVPAAAGCWGFFFFVRWFIACSGSRAPEWRSYYAKTQWKGHDKFQLTVWQRFVQWMRTGQSR